MKNYLDNIEQETIMNDNYRKVLFTALFSQLVVMCLKPGEEIGEEIHQGDQFIRIEVGEGVAVLNGEEFEISDDFAIMIPAGMLHNIINQGEDDMKLYTIYSPPEHEDGLVEPTKPED